MAAKILLIVSRFNQKITEAMFEGARITLEERGCDLSMQMRVDVPGAFELPLAAKWAADSGKWDGIICLGCVIQGETPHFDFVCSEAARGIMDVGLASGVPIIFGVLTTATEGQARARSGLEAAPLAVGEKPVVENKGADAAHAVCDMISVLDKLGSE